MQEQKIVFLDRDGTINVYKNYLYLIKEFEFIPGAIEGLKLLQDAGFILVVVTNQSGIGRGKYSEEDFLILDSWMKKKLAENGVDIWKTYYCPHLPGAPIKKYDRECSCRKPQTGLFFNAIKELSEYGEVNIERCYAIGDKMRDLTICNEQDIQGFLIDTDLKLSEGNIEIVDSLLSAAIKIIEKEKAFLGEMG